MYLCWVAPVINVQNPPGSPKKAGSLSLGENRVYFGLWALMKGANCCTKCRFDCSVKKIICQDRLWTNVERLKRKGVVSHS
eukprot:COSAG06_NODE_57286_length_281_cov_0.494505_1_plen_80_part_01